MKLTKLNSIGVSLISGIIFISCWIPFIDLININRLIKGDFIFFVGYILPFILMPIPIGIFLYKIDRVSDKKEKVKNIIIGIVSAIIISALLFTITIMIMWSGMKFGV